MYTIQSQQQQQQQQQQQSYYNIMNPSLLMSTTNAIDQTAFQTMDPFTLTNFTYNDYNTNNDLYSYNNTTTTASNRASSTNNSSSSSTVHPLQILSPSLHDVLMLSPSLDASALLKETSLDFMSFPAAQQQQTIDVHDLLPPPMTNAFDSGESRFSESNRDEDEESLVLSPIHSPLDDIFGVSNYNDEPAVISNEPEEIINQDTHADDNLLSSEEHYHDDDEEEEDYMSPIDDELSAEEEEEEEEEEDEEDDSDPDWASNNIRSRHYSAPVIVHAPAPTKQRRIIKKRVTSLPTLAMTDTADIKCTNCSTANTPLWRRSNEGFPLCNACGLFLKLHGVVRPLSLKTDVIKKRNRGPGVGPTRKRRSIKKKSKKKPTKRPSRGVSQTTGNSGNHGLSTME